MKNFFISIELYEISPLHSFHSFRSRWRVRNHFFAKYSDVNYFVLYATFNKVMASFITLTLQSRWCVRNISLQSAMTWTFLFSMRCLNDFWILFTFNVQLLNEGISFIRHLDCSVSEMERSHTFALAKVNVS